MLLSAKVVFVGSERIKSTKTGKEYLRVLLVQGCDDIKVLTDEFSFENLPKFQEYAASFSFNAQYNRFNLLDLKPVK